MRFPMNTYKGEGNSWGKLNVIVSFFQIAISPLAYVASFSGQLYFDRTYFFTLFQSNYFYTTVTFLWQLFLQNRYCFVLFHFFRTVTFSQELFFQNSFFFGVKILQSSHFLRTGSSLQQLLFGTAVFFSEELFRIKISKKSYFFKAGTSARHRPFQKSHILEKNYFSEN